MAKPRAASQNLEKRQRICLPPNFTGVAMFIDRFSALSGLFALAVFFISAPAVAAPETKLETDVVSLNDFLETKRLAAKLPAVGAAVVRNGAVVAVGVSGFRRNGSPEQVTLADKWHIGSCTKSMTATLTAMLVESGRLRWNLTLAEAFPQMAPQMRDGWRTATLEQLLAHRGGAPHDLNAQGLWPRIWQRASEPPRRQRAYLTEELLTEHDPAYATGTRFEYANSGYALVGHAIEEKLDQPYEEVLREKLFAPLKMTSAGFGVPASIGKHDQPWGHSLREGKMVPVAPGPGADNPAAIGPGGTVHCSISDLARYAAFHLRGNRSGDVLLKRESFRKLHTPFAADGHYALGWNAVTRDWGGGHVLTHNGTNTTNYTVMWLAPLRDFAVVASTNCDGEGVATAIDAIVGQLVKDYAPHANVP